MIGRARTVCPCGKRVFRDRIAANLFLASRGDTKPKRREVRSYKCEYHRWHVTSQARQ